MEKTTELGGVVRAPPSKSYTHRAIIAASLADGMSRIKSPLLADDITVTLNACMSLGAFVKQCGTEELSIVGSSELKAPREAINCGDSASTIRFLTPIAALARGRTVLDGSAGLRRRPIGPLIEALKQLGAQCTSDRGSPPVTVVGGTLRGGRASIVGDVSSQFVTGLLFACPLAEEETEIVLTTPLESKPYVKLTLNILKTHSIEVSTSEDFHKFTIPGKQTYTPKDHEVPGDCSAAAFLLAAAAITGSEATVENFFPDQPDGEIVNILAEMGSSVEAGEKSVKVSGGKLRGVTIDARDIPDLVPVCTVLACVADGATRIEEAGRLRIKESDRLSTISSELLKMGADITEEAKGLIIRGPCALRGAVIDSHGDHRIAMACAVAGLRAEGKTEILEAECVNKSYPNFFKDLKRLGARVCVR